MNKHYRAFLILFLFAATFLPAQMSRVSYFNAIILGNDVRLDFSISKGNSCSGYQILKSYDSTFYNVLYDYAGICGNTSTDESFSYTDGGVTKNTYVYYKILIPPFDYSKTIKLYVDEKKVKKTMLYTYPQPVQNSVTIYLDDQNYDDYVLRIIDCNGIMKKEISVNAYKYLNTDVADLDHGVYCLLLMDSSGNFSRGKVIKN